MRIHSDFSFKRHLENLSILAQGNFRYESNPFPSAFSSKKKNHRLYHREIYTCSITLVFQAGDLLPLELIFVNIVHTKHYTGPTGNDTSYTLEKNHLYVIFASLVLLPGSLCEYMPEFMPYGFQQPLNEIITHTEQIRTPRFRLRLFVCDICKKSFKQRVHLQDHMRSHTLEKPFKCHLCPQTFNRKSSAKRHLKVHWKD
ncbi:zinc finger protein [Nephila pilipes]|uniref:Zinc finger protein n=1 Tax=Nephila pilipes TaxID=299642 RepID=A0A8X6NPA9_NEPPI|nr:zinc finger protein [Nephila pilipes]